MYKRFLMVMVAMVSVSLFFMGCPTDSGSDDPEVYTVSFNANGGSAVAELTGIESGAKITKPTDPTKAGYTFSGWYKEEALTTAWNFESDTVTGNIPLYAKWTRSTAGQAAENVAGNADFSGKVTVSDTTLTLGQDVTITNDLTIGAGVSLVIPTGTKLTVSTGKTLILDGSTINVESGGTIIVPSVNADGSSDATTGQIVFQNQGKVVIKYGASGYYGSLLFVSSGDTSVYKWDSSSSNATITLTDKTTTLNGKLTCRTTTGIAKASIIVIGANSELVISNSAYFSIGGTLNGQGSNGSAAKVTVDSGATIGVETSSTPNGITAGTEAKTWTWNGTQWI
ncbi:MAG: InlB B-repeat-containing protein [Treponema sp.]|jgi:uncharacterized repeat protein (TIGR02543 family)|nr:InlB B-repeat-containing protein [Treponema sp.]